MNALDALAYADHLDRRLAAARLTLDTHQTSADTGVCRDCGQPGPCRQRTDARDLLARHCVPPLPPLGVRLAADAVRAADSTVDDLRTAWLTVVAAVDRAGAALHGVDRPDRMTFGWQTALVQSWQALGLVQDGLARARRLPGTPGESVATLSATLRIARADADRAAAIIAATRLRLIVAADLLRRTGGSSAGDAARQVAAALTRLDLAAARLAIGSRAIERYVARLAGRPAPAPARPPLLSADPPVTGQLSQGAQAAARLIRDARRRERPGFWSRVRADLREVL